MQHPLLRASRPCGSGCGTSSRGPGPRSRAAFRPPAAARCLWPCPPAAEIVAQQRPRAVGARAPERQLGATGSRRRGRREPHGRCGGHREAALLAQDDDELDRRAGRRLDVETVARSGGGRRASARGTRPASRRACGSSSSAASSSRARRSAASSASGALDSSTSRHPLAVVLAARALARPPRSRPPCARSGSPAGGSRRCSACRAPRRRGRPRPSACARWVSIVPIGFSVCSRKWLATMKSWLSARDRLPAARRRRRRSTSVRSQSFSSGYSRRSSVGRHPVDVADVGVGRHRQRLVQRRRSPGPRLPGSSRRRPLWRRGRGVAGRQLVTAELVRSGSSSGGYLAPATGRRAGRTAPAGIRAAPGGTVRGFRSPPPCPAVAAHAVVAQLSDLLDHRIVGGGHAARVGEGAQVLARIEAPGDRVAEPARAVIVEPWAWAASLRTRGPCSRAQSRIGPITTGRAVNEAQARVSQHISLRTKVAGPGG